MTRDVTLESGALRVTVKPHVGGTITGILHKPSGLSVLGRVPWPTVDAPLDSGAARDEPEWLTRYTGGWPLLFPSGGDAGTHEGTFHGFHGEGSIVPWESKLENGVLHLSHRFATVPVLMARTVSVEGDLVIVRERVLADGPEPVTVMWGHHPTFGSDLLAGEFELQSGAGTVLVDRGYDPPTNPLQPGAKGAWPIIAGKSGPVDLRTAPRGIFSAMAFLRDFAAPWISIRRTDKPVAVALSWDARVFPYCWLWYELGGNQDAPWAGKTKLIGLEPNTTCAGGGLAGAARNGEDLLVLQPGVPVESFVRLNVFTPRGPVRGVDAEGRAV
jgi:hypothetical protein